MLSIDNNRQVTEVNTINAIQTSTNRYNTIERIVTSVGATKKQISTPEGNYDFDLYCNDGDYYIGGRDLTISNGILVEQYDTVKLRQYQKNNGNELYAITTGATITIEAIAALKE